MFLTVMFQFLRSGSMCFPFHMLSVLTLLAPTFYMFTCTTRTLSAFTARFFSHTFSSDLFRPLGLSSRVFKSHNFSSLIFSPCIFIAHITGRGPRVFYPLGFHSRIFSPSRISVACVFSSRPFPFLIPRFIFLTFWVLHSHFTRFRPSLDQPSRFLPSRLQLLHFQPSHFQYSRFHSSHFYPHVFSPLMLTSHVFPGCVFSSHVSINLIFSLLILFFHVFDTRFFNSHNLDQVS